ncbi:hypothetical protein VDGD_20329 [Verticillium dahliae]|nr:hypothetical protein VDGD_20329 [Verticillium dahliae]
MPFSSPQASLPSNVPLLRRASPRLLLQEALPLDDLAAELDEEHGPAGPQLGLLLAWRLDAVRADAGGEAGAVAGALDDAGDKGGAVELAQLARHADEAVDERLVVDNHVLVGRVGVGALLEAVGLAAKEVLPEVLLDEVQQRDDVEWPQLGARRLAVEEEVEELEAEGVALVVEAAGCTLAKEWGDSLSLSLFVGRTAARARRRP